MKDQYTVPLVDLIPTVDDALAPLPVSGVALDSRQVKAGDLFFALAGSKTNGLDFARQALAQGAVAVVVSDQTPDEQLNDLQTVVKVADVAKAVGKAASRFYQHPSRAMRIIGITGTNGKTSCAHFLAQAMNRCGCKAAVLGTAGNGFPGHLKASTHTTLDAVTLHRTLAALRNQGAEAVVMEVSSHALDQQRVAGVAFDAVAFTNLSRDHLDYHGSMQAYAEAKARLFHDYNAPIQVLNLDDTTAQQWLTEPVAQGVERISYGLSADAAVNAQKVEMTAQGMMFELHSRWGEQFVSSRLLGTFNLSNLLLVAAVLGGLGYESTQIAQALSTLTPVSGRMECLPSGSGPSVIVDYAHTPDALEKALAAVRAHLPEQGRLWVLCGCGGDRDKGKRPMMADIAQKGADQVVLTSDNPRTESPLAILEDMKAGLKTMDHVRVEPDRAAAISFAVRSANAEDVILIAGKGHETYQEIDGVRHPFSDQEQARIALQARRVLTC